jgi:hypothetical protein
MIRKFLDNKEIKVPENYRTLLEGRISFIYKLSKNITYKQKNDEAKLTNLGFLIPDRLPKYAKDSTHYKECSFCKSTICKSQMAKHAEMCKKRSKATLDYVIRKIPECEENSMFPTILDLIAKESSKTEDNEHEAFKRKPRKPRKLWTKIETNMLRNIFSHSIKNKTIPSRSQITKAVCNKPLINERSVTTIHEKLKAMMKKK